MPVPTNLVAAAVFDVNIDPAVAVALTVALSLSAGNAGVSGMAARKKALPSVPPVAVAVAAAPDDVVVPDKVLASSSVPVPNGVLFGSTLRGSTRSFTESSGMIAVRLLGESPLIIPPRRFDALVIVIRFPSEKAR